MFSMVFTNSNVQIEISIPSTMQAALLASPWPGVAAAATVAAKYAAAA